MNRRSGGAKRRQWWCRILWTFSNYSSCWIFLNLLAIFVCTFECAESLHALSPRVVFTKQGPVQGILGPGNIRPQVTPSTFNFRNYGSLPVVEIFKGIPYASPPVDSLRYESPAPLTPRSKQEVYSANITKPPCPRYRAEVLNRTNYPENPLRAIKRMMHLDDCLYLDIYAPLNTEKNRGQGLAVLVYVNSQQDDPEDPFDGSSMAAIGNVIVISFRYRVGVLGFLQPGFSEDVRSNFGLWDQLAALQWIKVNIEEFGGDPNQICLMGYDMDATLAGLLALSPVSQAYDGLFHRLILLNGSPFSPNSINLRPLETTFQLARTLKCPLDDRAGGLVNCLRRVTTPQLLGAAESVGNPLLSYPFAPTVDGTIVREDVNQNGHGNTNKDMLGKYDLLCGIKEGMVLPKIGRPLISTMTLENFVTAAIKMIMKMETGSEPTDNAKREVVSAILNEYGPSPNMRELVSHFLMVHPMIDLLNTHSKTGRNTFFYVFKDYDPLRKMKQNEISYIFSSSVYKWQYIDSHSKPNYKLEPFQLLISLLANFARTGDPNTIDSSSRYENPSDLSQKTSKWTKYTAESGRYLEIGKDVRFPSFYQRQFTNFWGNIIPSIIHPFSKIQNQTGGDYGSFPPYHTNHHNIANGHNPSNDNSPYPHFNNNRNVHDIVNVNSNPTDESSPAISSIGSNTVVLIGCVLLLLNFLCFMGLFYQRERLKKAEIQLRKRYLQSQKSAEDTSNSHEMDGSSYYDRERDTTTAHDIEHLAQPTRMTATNMQIQQMRDAMSETETENGFGPDFLGPNYDPRTKVNRWMNMQNRLKQDSFDRPTPSPPVDYINAKEDQVLPMLAMPVPAVPPMNIHVSSLQRNFQPPKAQPEPPVQFLPPFPYQEPFQPNHLLVSDIPYADSRATSPSVISAPATFSNNKVPEQRGIPSPYSAVPPHTLSPHHTNLPGTVPNHSIIIPSLSDSGGSKSPPLSLSPNPSNRTLSPLGNSKPTPKRASVLIVRDLDPVDNDVENAGPKFVPVKTGTLKRSVGVDTAHDNSASRDIIEPLPQVQKVTFSDGL